MNNQLKYRTMTQKRVNKETKIKAMMAEDADFLRPLVRSVIQEFLEAEMAVAIGAEKGERVEGRLGYRSGYYPRSLITRVGKLGLRVPQVATSMSLQEAAFANGSLSCRSWGSIACLAHLFPSSNRPRKRKPLFVNTLRFVISRSPVRIRVLA